MNGMEGALRELGRELVVPEAPDLSGAVLDRIERRSERRRPSPRRLVLVLAVVALALLGATLAIPEARSALFRILHIGGERIEIVDELPEIPVTEGIGSSLGRRVTIEEARRRATFDLRELDQAPDEIYLGERGRVWFLYGPAQRPRLLVAQTPLLSVPVGSLVKKLAGAGTRVEQVDVDGSPGIFLSGEAHFLFLVDENGRVVEDSARLARDVLVWERSGVAYRIEGDLELPEALDLADSLR